MFMDIVHTHLKMQIQTFFLDGLFVYCCVIDERVQTGKSIYTQVHLCGAGVQAKFQSQRSISYW